jgi:hypothetical protein
MACDNDGARQLAATDLDPADVVALLEQHLAKDATLSEAVKAALVAYARTVRVRRRHPPQTAQ